MRPVADHLATLLGREVGLDLDRPALPAADPVAVAVVVGIARTDVAGVAHAVAVAVGLVRVGDRRAVVVLVQDAVAAEMARPSPSSVERAAPFNMANLSDNG